MNRVFLIAALGCSVLALQAQPPNELRFVLHSEPKTFHPLLVDDDASETIRYLTGGVLIRVNRKTEEFEPELAASWKIADQGRRIVFKLRQGVKFSDGTPLSADDVIHTFNVLMDPNLHSPAADAFRSGSERPRVTARGEEVSMVFSAPVSGVERLFDQIPILSARSPKKEMAVAGPFFVAERKAGVEIVLRANPYYWKRDASGRQLPYLAAIRLGIQQNRDMEVARFRRGELHLIESLGPESYEKLAAEQPSKIHDLGPSLDSEFFWFNQIAKAVPPHKLAWFQSTAFRKAVSEAVNRNDLCRLVYGGHAQPSRGPVSPANRFWFNGKLKPHDYDPGGAQRRLTAAGFQLRDGKLFDQAGNAVVFSLITNTGNAARQQMAAMIQQDLKKIGITLNIVTLDFPSLVERITRTYQYEACLLGLTNLDLDPNSVMNVWLSSASNHQWNPGQAKPVTTWEAEIDRLMQAQASTIARDKRKAWFDRVQEIVWDQEPFVYLVVKNSLAAFSPSIRNISPGILRPQIYWNAEQLQSPMEAVSSR